MKVWAAIAGAVSVCAASAFPVQAAPPPLETYGALPTLEQVEISPDGTKLAYVGATKGVRALTVIEIGGGILASSPVGTIKLRDIRWAGNDIVLIANTSTKNWGFEWGGENMELLEVVSIDLKHKTSFPIFSKARALGPVFGRYGVRQINGRWYGFYGGLETQFSAERDVIPKDGYVDLFKIDLETGDATLVADGREHNDGWQIGPDGAVMAFSLYEPGSAVWKLFAAKAQTPIVTRSDAFDGSAILGLGRTANTVIVGPADEEGNDFAEVRLEGAGSSEKLQTPADVRRLWFDQNTHQLIGYTYGASQRQIQMFDAKAQARVSGAMKAFPDHAVEVVSTSQDFGRLVLFTSGGDDPGSYWLIDIATGKARPLGSEYPIEGKDVGEVRTIDYKAADGTEIHGVLTLPPGSKGKNLPVVVLPHGGPASRDFAVFDWWAQAFASRGYAVFQPNFRGSTGFGKAFHDAGYGQWGRKMQTDISDGVAALAKEGVIDPKRACIVGASYGGYAALAGVTVQHGLYRCAVSYAGVADLSAMLAENELNDPSTRYWKTFMGAKSPNDPVLKTISPIALKDQADAPILLIHGKDDTVVSPKQSTSMEKALKSAGKPVQLITLEGEDHWLSRAESRTAMLKAAVAFVEKNNPAN